VEGDIAIQTARVLTNMAAILEAADSNLSKGLKTTVYLVDLDDFARMNQVYAKFLGSPPRDRAAVQVARLPREAAVEIEVIAEG